MAAVVVETRVDEAICLCAIVAVATAAIVVLVAGTACRRDLPRGRSAPQPRWTSLNPTKRWLEWTLIASSPLWIAMMAFIIATRWYETFSPTHYLVFGFAIVTPGLLAPALTQPPEELARPLWQRYWVRDHAWLWIITFVGSYFWTHYFYALLGATYTFEAWRLNDVPFAMYLAAHAYFLLYHSLTNLALRRWYTSDFAARLPSPALRHLGTAALVAILSWVTAFMEAFTIQGFPYYNIADRPRMYTVGSIVYGIYFLVTFPMHYELEGGEPEADSSAQGARAPSSEPRIGGESLAASAAAAAAESGGGVRAGSASPAGAMRTRAQRRGSKSPTPSAAKRAASPSPAAVAASSKLDGGGVRAASIALHAQLPDGDFHGELAAQAPRPWSLWSTALHALAAAMIVTLLLDWWRLAYSAAAGALPAPAPGLPWTVSGSVPLLKTPF